jgi:hypothetical protein
VTVALVANIPKNYLTLTATRLGETIKTVEKTGHKNLPNSRNVPKFGELFLRCDPFIGKSFRHLEQNNFVEILHQLAKKRILVMT